MQNLGGIGNMTIVAPGKDPIAFDTGPANALIDHAAAKLSGGKMRYDVDGAWAGHGTVNQPLVDELMAHPYFKMRPPKSTGKESFGPAFADGLLARGLDPADCMATLTAFSARSIAEAYRDFAPDVRNVYLSGGGVYNKTMITMLTEMLHATLPQIRLHSTQDLGLPPDSKEAIAFALLGYQLVHGRPGAVASCTGARYSAVLGSLTPGNNFRELMKEPVRKQHEAIRNLVIDSA
jgi:anhydro-N-acetylmuramic acid kinase